MTNKEWDFPKNKFIDSKEWSMLRLQAQKELMIFKDQVLFLKSVFGVKTLKDIPEIELPRLIQMCKNAKLEDTK